MGRTFLYALLACICAMNPLKGTDLKDKQDMKQDLRILKLLPNLLCPLAVEPGIPEDFVALSATGPVDLYDWVYWGPQDVLEAYFENSNSLKVPILRVKLSPNIAQKGPKSFNNEKLLKILEEKNPKGFAFFETQWGDYPVFAIKTVGSEGQLIFVAWVGLNDPATGWTLMFNLVYPNENETKSPSITEGQLWENLLVKTTQLKDGDYFKACGQDLQEGYTLVNISEAKLKMLAEKRQSDGMMQVVVIPEDSGVEFHYVDMIECRMGAKWKYGEPLVKIYGEIVVNNKNFKSIIPQVTSIFFKTVPEFTFNKEDEKNLLIFQKICDSAE